ncbi:hypothetical protein Tco_1317686 [Tanacetum coccineum]
MLDSYTSDMCMQSWGRSSYARAMIELRADVELKDNIVVAMSKITREGYYTCNIRVECEWKPPRCACCKVFVHVQEEYPKNIGSSERRIFKIPMYCDSQSAIAISCNLVQHSRTKHIHTRYHFIKEQVENGIIELYFCQTEYQLADMFTKALPEERFQYLVRRIGMRCLTPAELEVLTNESA